VERRYLTAVDGGSVQAESDRCLSVMWVTVPIRRPYAVRSVTVVGRPQADVFSVSQLGEVETIAERDCADDRTRREMNHGGAHLGDVEDGILVARRIPVMRARRQRADRNVERSTRSPPPVVLDGDVNPSGLPWWRAP